MKVAWLLVGPVMFWVRDLKLKLDQSDASKETKSPSHSSLLQIKGHYEEP